MITRMIAFAALGLIVSVGSVFAFESRIIDVSPEGKLIGMPNEYQPAMFSRRNGILKVGDGRAVFPECINRYLRDDKVQVFLSGFWGAMQEQISVNLRLLRTTSTSFERISLRFDFDLPTMQLTGVHSSQSGQGKPLVPAECADKVARVKVRDSESIQDWQASPSLF